MAKPEQDNNDLSLFETLDTAVMTVESPKGGDLEYNGAPVTITLYGPGSQQFIRAKHRLDMNVQARSVALLRGNSDRRAAEENLKDTAEFLAAVTVKIDNFPVTDAFALYTNPKLRYITDQVDRYLSKTENFMPA
jgi:hypothetical protein